MRIDNIVCSAGLRRCLPETCGLFFVNRDKPQVPAKTGRGHALRGETRAGEPGDSPRVYQFPRDDPAHRAHCSHSCLA
jgi:hypothetical protein